MITVQDFAAAVPCSIEIAEVWQPWVSAAMDRWEVNTPERAAGFIAQMSHESAHFTKFEEDLRYRAQRLAAVWPHRYAVNSKARPLVPNQLAVRLHLNPELIANHTYANRGGNGPPESGDGWRYRGRGPKQITFADNYRRCGTALGLPLLRNPDLLLTPEHGAMSAGWYWASHGCNQLMDCNQYAECTKAINGGLIGYEDGNDSGYDDRVEQWALARTVLGVA